MNAVVAEAWEKVSKSLNKNERTPSAIIQEQTLRLTELEPATDYVASVSVKNKYGWSPDSVNFPFSTKKGEQGILDWIFILAFNKDQEHHGDSSKEGNSF